MSASDNVSYQKQTARSAGPNCAVPSADELGASPHVLGQEIIGPFRRMRESADLGLPTIREGLMDPNPRIPSVPPPQSLRASGFGVYLTPYLPKRVIFPEVLKKRGVGMVVGAPSRCTRYTHASDGSAWSSGERGSIAEA